MDPRTDNQLMLQVRGGDRDALGVLFERHHAKVHALCYRMTNSRSAAADLVQEAFLRILRYRHSYAGDARFTTWLYRLARNVCLDYVRSVEREAAGARRWEVEARTDPGQAATEVERLDLLQQALHRLPADKREVLILSRYHDLRYEDIARVCGCSVGAVKVRVHRALNELRESYRALERQEHGLQARAGSGR